MTLVEMTFEISGLLKHFGHLAKSEEQASEAKSKAK
jgi:anti-anti-sigma regulatory factor